MNRTFITLAAALWMGSISATTFAAETEVKARRNYAQMLEQGEVRMAVPFERVTYVESKKQILGVAPQIAKYLGSFLSKKYKKPIQVKIVPSVLGNMLNEIDQGNADFALVYGRKYEEQLKSDRKSTRLNSSHT